MTLADVLRTVVRQARASPAASRPAHATRPLAPGSPAPPIEGVSFDGSPAKVVVSDVPLTLFFLTSQCRECEDAWLRTASDAPASEAPASGVPASEVPASEVPVPGAPRLVVVTPGPETESARRVAARLAEVGSLDRRIRVVMSSAAWHAYGVTKAPWVVDIDGGTVVGTGPFAM